MDDPQPWRLVNLDTRKRKASSSPEGSDRRPERKKRRKRLKPKRDPSLGKRKYKKSILAKALGANKILNNGESGWTPIDLYRRPTWRQFRMDELKRDSQRGQLGGFDSNQLEAMEAIPALIMEEQSFLELDNEIHPIFALENWRSHKSIPANHAFWRIGRGKYGYWEAHNPIVWKELVPILRLASQFLDNSFSSHWWDTLLNGDRRDLPELPGSGYRTLHRRPAEVFYANREQIRLELLQASGLISFGIDCGYINVSTGLFPPPTESGGEAIYNGYTIQNDVLGVDPVQISIAQHLLKPLLRKTITQAEKLGAQFNIAMLLIHELGHAIGDLFRRLHSDTEEKYPRVELFFEDEALAEYGYSLVMANMNYIPGLLPHRPSPLIYAVHQWPRGGGDSEFHTTTLKYARPLESYQIPKVYYPLPCRYFYDIARRDFWKSFVPIYGVTGKALHPGLLVSGSQFSTNASGKTITKLLPAMPHEAALPIDLNSKDSITAHTIQTGRIADQKRAMAALAETRGLLSDWRARFHSKQNKHEWYDWNEKKSQDSQDVDNPSSEPDSPYSDLTNYSDAGGPVDLDNESGTESDFSHEAISAPSETIQYIHSSLCNLRLILALDTMHYHVPMHTFLEYLNRELKKSKCLVVSPEDFEAYLRFVAIEKGICFNIFIHPADLIEVTYRPDGWPSEEAFVPIPRPLLPPLERNPTRFAADVAAFRALSLGVEIWRMRTAAPRARRCIFIDLDSEDIRLFFNETREEEADMLDEDDFAHVVAACPDLWVFGPPGILRFAGPEPWPGARQGANCNIVDPPSFDRIPAWIGLMLMVGHEITWPDQENTTNSAA